MKQGLYEQIINRKMTGELEGIPDNCKHQEKGDSAEASRVLSAYVAELLQKKMDSIYEASGEDALAREYGFSSRNAARYLRINYLIRPFKDMMDRNEIPLLSAVDVSYISEEEQQALYDLLTGRKLKLMPKMAAQLRKASGNLDEEKMLEIVDGLKVKKNANGVILKLPMAICSKYFEGMNAEQMASLVERALDAWFAGKEAADVQ